MRRARVYPDELELDQGDDAGELAELDDELELEEELEELEELEEMLATTAQPSDAGGAYLPASGGAYPAADSLRSERERPRPVQSSRR